VHLPDVLQLPGFISATRCVNIDPDAGPGRFLAIYDIESDDIDKTLAVLDDNMARWEKQGRISKLLVIVSVATYRQMGCLAKQDV